MKIAFDLHGVLDTYPEQMKPELSRLVSAGHEVIILSGAFSEDIRDECTSLGLCSRHYTQILSLLDYGVHTLGLTPWEAVSPRTGKMGTYINDDIWWALKAILCRIYKVYCLFDDKREYSIYFGPSHPTEFILFDQFYKEKLREL